MTRPPDREGRSGRDAQETQKTRRGRPTAFGLPSKPARDSEPSAPRMPLPPVIRPASATLPPPPEALAPQATTAPLRSGAHRPLSASEATAVTEAQPFFRHLTDQRSWGTTLRILLFAAMLAASAITYVRYFVLEPH